MKLVNNQWCGMGVLFFGRRGWVPPKALCPALGSRRGSLCLAFRSPALWEAEVAVRFIRDEDLGGSWVMLSNRGRVVSSAVRHCPAISKAHLGRGKPAVVAWPVPLHRWAGRPHKGVTGRESPSSTSLSTVLLLEDLGRWGGQGGGSWIGT